MDLARLPSPHWLWSELTAALGLPDSAGPTIHRVVTDSRTVAPGDLFVALAGDPGARFNPSQRTNNDGHNFLQQAQERGAAGAVVMAGHPSAKDCEDLPRLPVRETYDALWALGRAGRERQQGPIVAVTGSSGKTTLKTFLGAALTAYTSPGSFNNHIGVPLSLANMPVISTDKKLSGVFEIGTNHPGEIEPLANMCRPDVAVVLNVQQAHIENFADATALRKEKLCIFKALSDISHSVSEDTLTLPFGASFGLTESADARVMSVSGDRCVLRLFGQELDARVPGGGAHRALCVAATVLVTHMLGADLQPALALSDELVPAGRGSVDCVGEVCVVDDSYNANPASMQAALRSLLEQTQPGRRIAVIGEMGELGSHTVVAHADLAPLLEQFDLVYCVGASAQDLAAIMGAEWFADTEDSALLETLLDVVASSDTVFVKGSNRVFWANNFVNRLKKLLEDRR